MKTKYPKTPHLHWSPGFTPDDIVHDTSVMFEGEEVVATEKMDGENTSMYSDYIHARSIDSRNHESRNWVRRLHSEIKSDIPENYRICGENLYAQHSIFYNDLESYFIMFSIWNEKNFCLSWDETLEWAGLLNLKTPKVFYRGIWDEEKIRGIKFDMSKVEGYVVRKTKSFHYDDFNNNIAKWVRKYHVQTDSHWMYSKINTNKLLDL